MTSYAKVNSKWTEDWDTRPEIIKYVEENTGTELMHLVSEGCFELDHKGKGSKIKINGTTSI